MRLLKLIILFPVLISCTSNDSINSILNTNSGVEINKVVDLSSELNETSGLINFNGTIITHNDGDQPYLYEVDTKSGAVNRTVEISNIAAKDIEDICQDENYIYLADIGNNSNTRTDLVIYKINKLDYLENDHVSAEQIEISYKDQTDFAKSNNSTNYDAEALVAIGNNLFLFTKNWKNLKTSVYKIPKLHGKYQLDPIDSYDIGGLITGASYNKNKQVVLLIGYHNISPFVVRLSDFSINNPLDGKIEKENILVLGSVQIEGVAANPNDTYYISAERNLGFPASLHELKFN